MRRLNAVADPVITTTPATPARNPRRSTTVWRTLAVLVGVSGSQTAVAGAAACGVASRHSRTNVPIPASTDTRQATIASAVESCGSVTIAHNPTSPNAAKPTGATIHRCRAARPSTAPSRIDVMTIPVTSAGLSLVPNVSTANCLRDPAKRSTNSPPTAVTGDVAECTAAAASSPAASAAPAARAPVRAAAARPGTEGGVVRCRSRHLLGEQHCTMIATACGDVQSSSETNAKLPAPSQSARAPATYAPGVAPTAGPMVLVVDDEPMVREVVARYLEHDGMRVHELGDGEAAVQWLGEHDADLVVLDVMLPGVDGLSLLRQHPRRSATRR